MEVAEEDASGRKKRRKVTEMKYVYEPEMEGESSGEGREDRRHVAVPGC